MNIVDYISSGVVESCVLGLSTNEENAEFERMCAAHAEVRKAREDFEIALERYALQNGLPPPRHLKSKIFSEIDIEEDRAKDTAYRMYPLALPEQQSQAYQRVPMWWRYVAAASIIMLVGSAILNIYLYNQYQESSRRFNGLAANQSELAQANQVMQSRLNTYEQSMAIMKDPDMAMVKLSASGVPSSPDSTCMSTVYWNTQSKDVFLLVNKLPPPQAEKQYQLWAIVNGQPVDAGVFDTQHQGLIKMKNIPKAEAFAVTLEKKGGSDQPTMHAMYVLGKV